MESNQFISDPLSDEFKKVPNPELRIYIYPHLAGNEELPIPGYWTMSNVCGKDHYEVTHP